MSVTQPHLALSHHPSYFRNWKGVQDYITDDKVNKALAAAPDRIVKTRMGGFQLALEGVHLDGAAFDDWNLTKIR